MTLGPLVRLLENFAGTKGKRYVPQELCGEDVQLAANRMPAYYVRLRASAAQPAEADELTVAVASPPVMCWICGEGFTHVGDLVKHCIQKRGEETTPNIGSGFSGERRRMASNLCCRG